MKKIRINKLIITRFTKEEAASGNSEAKYKLGLSYLIGGYFERDNEKACYWLKAASEKAHIEARELYGKLLENAR